MRYDVTIYLWINALQEYDVVYHEVDEGPFNLTPESEKFLNPTVGQYEYKLDDLSIRSGEVRIYLSMVESE